VQCNCFAQEQHINRCHCRSKRQMGPIKGSTEAGTIATPGSAPSASIALKIRRSQAQESWQGESSHCGILYMQHKPLDAPTGVIYPRFLKASPGSMQGSVKTSLSFAGWQIAARNCRLLSR